MYDLERTEAEAPILWPADAKSRLTGKDSDAGKDWRQKEKGRQRMRWLDGITNSTDMNLSKHQDIVKNRKVWCATVHRVTKSWTWLSMLEKIGGRRRRGWHDEMVGWHYQLNGHESEQALGVGNAQGSLVCCSSWCCKESDMTEQLNWTELSNYFYIIYIVLGIISNLEMI